MPLTHSAGSIGFSGTPPFLVTQDLSPRAHSCPNDPDRGLVGDHASESLMSGAQVRRRFRSVDPLATSIVEFESTRTASRQGSAMLRSDATMDDLFLPPLGDAVGLGLGDEGGRTLTMPQNSMIWLVRQGIEHSAQILRARDPSCSNCQAPEASARATRCEPSTEPPPKTTAQPHVRVPRQCGSIRARAVAALAEHASRHTPVKGSFPLDGESEDPAPAVVHQLQPCRSRDFRGLPRSN